MLAAVDAVGEIHASLLIGLPALVLLAMRAPGERPRPFRVLAGLAAGGLCAAWLSSRAAHPGCPLGEPLLQWIVPSAALAAALALVGPLPARLAIAVLAFALGSFGTTSYLEAIHTDAWTGAPGPVLAAPGLTEYAAEALAGAGSGDGAEYPPGFLVGSPALAAHAEALALVPLASVRIDGVAQWHTRFTGLYRQRHTAVGVWFPGGRLAAGAARLALRDLPPDLAHHGLLRHAHRRPAAAGS